MIVALNRRFETAPLIAPTLFVPNIFDSMEKVAGAYTATGGAFLRPKELLADLGVPANRIYLAAVSEASLTLS